MPTATNDHDLLVRLDTKMDGLGIQFSKIELAVASKADAIRVEKLEQRLDAIEKKIYMIAGGLAVVEIALRLLLK